MRSIRALVMLLVAMMLPVLLPTPAHAADGDFIRVYPDNPAGPVYRMAGGAPIYVSKWAAVGQPSTGGPYTDVSQAYFNSLPAHPADGTVTNDALQTYRWVGGAPVVVTNWANIDGEKPSTRIDPRAISEAGTLYWSGLRQKPLDGTQVVGRLPGDPENGTGFVIVGGAPIAASSWDAAGGAHSPTVIDMLAIRNAGNGQAWYDHLRYRPLDGTQLNDGTTCYTVTAGAPIATGAGACGIRVDPAAIANAGRAGPWSHLNAPPPPPPPPPAPTPVRTVSVRAIKKHSKPRIDVGPDSASSDYEVYVQRWQRRKWRTLVVVLTTGPRDVHTVNPRRGRYRVLLPAFDDVPQVVSSGVRLKR